MSEATDWEEQRAEFCALVQQLSPADALLVLRTLCDECSDERAVISTLVSLVKESAQLHGDKEGAIRRGIAQIAGARLHD